MKTKSNQPPKTPADALRTTNMLEVHATLEIAGHHRGHDAERYDRAIEMLRGCQFGAGIVAHCLHNTHEQPAKVPDFRHDRRCQCENPEPWGVLRYCGVTLYLVFPTLGYGVDYWELMRDYWLIQGHTMVDLCGFTHPNEPNGIKAIPLED